ncbi:MAG TPA: CDP-alcohol phosphatidyltransferase family protein [Polyangiaceae bacterium]|jgi:CDP-diacylglycerol--glycerol-3-phosphate 3-phosphatidyltransferase/cardiolipin synthase
MGLYRARDLVRVPGLLSLSRLPLAAAFPFVLVHPLAALGVLAAAGFSDVLDGWYARRFGQVTATGSALDPVTDKLFVTTVAVSLVVGGYLSVLDVALLSAREIGELPLVAWLAFNRHARRRRAGHPSANVPGKLATVLQFGTATAALFRMPHLGWLIDGAAAVGMLAATSYWLREIRILRHA